MYSLKSLCFNCFNFVSQVAWTALTKWQRSWRSCLWTTTRQRVQRTRKRRWRKRRKRRRLARRRRNEPGTSLHTDPPLAIFPFSTTDSEIEKLDTFVFFFLAAWLHKTLVPLLMRPFLNHQDVVSFCPIHKLSYRPSFSHTLWTSRQSSCICVFTRHAMIQGLCYWLIPTLGNLFCCFSFVL